MFNPNQAKQDCGNCIHQDVCANKGAFNTVESGIKEVLSRDKDTSSWITCDVKCKNYIPPKNTGLTRHAHSIDASVIGESDIEVIAEKLYEAQQRSLRGRGVNS